MYAIVSGGLDTGWTFYTPFSTVASTTAVVPAALGIFINGFSGILTGLNFIVTIHKMRAPGMTWFRLPLFVWAHYATSLIQVLGTPVLAITIVLVAAERIFGFGLFNPAVGGDPVLFQHLFWFYSHPAVYIMILPAMGIVSELVAAFSRKQVFGYTFVAFASIGIAVIGFLVWGHHMFVSGESVYAALVFSVLSFIVAIPSAVKVFNWTATMYKGVGVVGDADALRRRVHRSLHDRRPDRAVPGVDGPRRPPHRHLLHRRALPLRHGRRHDHGLPRRHALLVAEDYGPDVQRTCSAKISAAIMFVGFNLTFFPQFVLGYLGMPRRYHAYPEEFQVLNVLSSAGASVLAVGYLLPLFYFAYSLKYGEIAGDNPWGAVGLEWNTTSPPPTENFTVTPVVTWEAYEYPTPVEGHVV